MFTDARPITHFTGSPRYKPSFHLHIVGKYPLKIKINYFSNILQFYVLGPQHITGDNCTSTIVCLLLEHAILTNQGNVIKSKQSFNLKKTFPISCYPSIIIEAFYQAHSYKTFRLLNNVVKTLLLKL